MNRFTGKIFPQPLGRMHSQHPIDCRVTVWAHAIKPLRKLGEGAIQVIVPPRRGGSGDMVEVIVRSRHFLQRWEGEILLCQLHFARDEDFAFYSLRNDPLSTDVVMGATFHLAKDVIDLKSE